MTAVSCSPQVAAVRQVLAERMEWNDVPVTAVLLFMSDGNWSLFDMRPLRFGSVYALWGKALGKLIRAEGAAGAIDVPELERALATALSPA